MDKEGKTMIDHKNVNVKDSSEQERDTSDNTSVKQDGEISSVENSNNTDGQTLPPTHSQHAPDQHSALAEDDQFLQESTPFVQDPSVTQRPPFGQQSPFPLDSPVEQQHPFVEKEDLPFDQQDSPVDQENASFAQEYSPVDQQPSLSSNKDTLGNTVGAETEKSQNLGARGQGMPPPSDVPITPSELFVSAPPPKKKPHTVKGFLFTLCLSVALIFGLAVFYLYSAGQKVKQKPIPTVRPITPLKEQPLNPEGMEIQYLDKLVYGIVSDRKESPGKIEHLLPKPEQPINVKKQNLNRAKQKKKAPKNSAVNKQGKNAPTLGKTVAKGAKKPAQKRESAQKPAQKRESAQKPAPLPKSAPLPKKWRIQLASVRSLASAKGVLATAFDKYPALKKYTPHIERIKVGNTLYYRTQIIGFTNKILARTLCSRIKKDTGQCFVKNDR